MQSTCPEVAVMNIHMNYTYVCEILGHTDYVPHFTALQICSMY